MKTNVTVCIHCQTKHFSDSFDRMHDGHMKNGLPNEEIADDKKWWIAEQLEGFKGYCPLVFDEDGASRDEFLNGKVAKGCPYIVELTVIEC